MNTPYLILAARVCLSLIFLNAGIKHLQTFGGFQETIASLGMPLPGLTAVVSIVLLLLGGLSLLLGFKPCWGAICLIVFLVPTTLIVHNPLNPEQWQAFLKNVAFIGGLLPFLNLEAGVLSLDSLLAKSDRSTPIASE